MSDRSLDEGTTPRRAPSAAWIVATLVALAVLALAGGAVLRAAFGEARGTLLAPHESRELGVRFAYPVYADVETEAEAGASPMVSVDRLGVDSGDFSSAATEFDRTVSFTLTTQEGPGLEAALDAGRARCVEGPQGGADADGSDPTAVRADYDDARVEGRPARTCRQVLRYPTGGTVQQVVDAQLLVEPELLVTVHLVTFGDRLTREQRGLIDGVIRSVEPL